jgi:DNA replication protein DnaC
MTCKDGSQLPLNVCPNCGGHENMRVYIPTAGPFRSPNGAKATWLDFPDDKSKNGWYTYDLHIAHCPVCRRNGMAEYLQRNSGLKGADLELTLSGFSTTGTLAAKQTAKDQAAALLAMNRKPGGIYTFWGSYGCGKSHLLKAIVNGFRLMGVMSQYQVMSEMLAAIRERFGDEKGGVSAEEVIDNLQQVKVLCIDELDRANLTSWAKETIFRLVDARYNRPDLATVFATNTDPQDLSGEFGYIVSRMKAGVILEIPGPDVREALGLKAQQVHGAE